MTRPPVPPARVAATAVVSPYAGSGPLTPAQLRRARVRMALEQLAVLVEDLEASPAPVRQAACTALAAVVELQAGPGPRRGRRASGPRSASLSGAARCGRVARAPAADARRARGEPARLPPVRSSAR